MKPRIIIVDDEKNIRRTLSMILGGAGYAVREAGSGEEGLSLLAEAPSEAVLLDVGLPGMDGITALKEIQRVRPGTAVIMISGQATVATAVEASREGAFDFLEKPLSKDRVLISVRNALRVSRLGEEVDRLQRTEARRRVMVGESAALRALREQIDKVGPTAATVLITGESGTGKELVARAVHEASPRTGRAFVKVNCAAIPEELIETELFGCVRGAYTGADRSRDGKFTQADGGTIFLDEIGDMSLRVQAKVLRALQEGEIERVGDAKVQCVDVRVIAATNKDLATEVAAKRFREDLFFRLNVVPLAVPSLDDRREDIPALANHFLELYSLENDLPVPELSAEARRRLQTMDWRGNIRELRNMIERLAILSAGPAITDDDVQALASPLLTAQGSSMDAAQGTAAATTESATGTTPLGAATGASTTAGATEWTLPSLDDIQAMGGLTEARRDFERRCIEMALDHTAGNVSEAARRLGVERSNLHKKMQSLDLEARPPRTSETGPNTEAPS